MKNMNSIKATLFLLLALLCTNAYSQFGVIEMKNGEQYEMMSPELIVEGDQLRYFEEEWKRKTAVMGIGNRKKARQEFEEKSRLINISDIKKIHASGQLMYNDKPFLDFVGIRYIKTKRHYEKYYVITEGKCSFLTKLDLAYGWYSHYVQTGNEEPFELHRGGVGLGPKFKKKSKKYFADCEPAMEYIKGELKKSTISELVEIYNANCAD